MDVWTYFAQKEREFAELSLVADRETHEMFAEENGSDGRRGRVFGSVVLMEGAFIAISEVVVVRGNRIHREEYAYFLVIDGIEAWGYERDLSHRPPVHRHTEGHVQRLVAGPIAFKRVAEKAWEEVTRRKG